MGDPPEERTIVSYSILQNAQDSLIHAVDHLILAEEPTASDLKRAILDVSHAAELLLKEKVRLIHPAFLWEKVDQYPNKKAQIIGYGGALRRLNKIGKIAFSEEDIEVIKKCRELRNSIEHHEFILNSKKTRIIIGRILSFIFRFAGEHLGLDWEEDFKENRKWKKLLEFREFFEKHKDVCEKKLLEMETSTLICPSCGGMTYDLSIPRCILCDHFEERAKCERCEEEYWESETNTHEEIDGDWKSQSVYGFTVTLCHGCEDEIAIEEYYPDEY